MSKGEAIKTGQAIENLSLVDPSGKPVNLRELGGKQGMVVGFMHGTYCPHCIHQLSRSNRLAKRLQEHDITLAWILRDEATSIAAYQLVTSPPPQFALLPDENPSVALRFGVAEADVALQPAPFMFYLDDSGTVRLVIDKSDNPHAPTDADQLLADIGLK